jgi:hypothetical protein|nr:MAG TPA: hypothetical protein [Caudoviricetes sp.]
MNFEEYIELLVCRDEIKKRVNLLQRYAKSTLTFSVFYGFDPDILSIQDLYFFTLFSYNSLFKYASSSIYSQRKDSIHCFHFSWDEYKFLIKYNEISDYDYKPRISK